MGKGRIKLDIIGQKFNRLLVVEQVEDEIDAKSGKHKSRYKCYSMKLSSSNIVREENHEQ